MHSMLYLHICSVLIAVFTLISIWHNCYEFRAIPNSNTADHTNKISQRKKKLYIIDLLHTSWQSK